MRSISWNMGDYTVNFNNIGTDGRIDITEPHNTADYIIFKDDDGIVYAKNGKTGRIDFQGTAAASVIQSAINSLTNKGKILLTDLFTITSTISLKSNTTLSGTNWNTGLKLGNNINKNILFISGDNIKIENLKIDGNADNQSATSHGIYEYFSGNNVTIENVYFYNIYSSGVYLRGRSYHKISGCFFEDIAGGGGEGAVHLRDGSWAIVSNNRIYMPNKTANGIFLEYFSRASVFGNIQNYGFHGVHLRNTSYITIGNNIIENVSGAGIEAASSGSFSDIVITNNSILNTGERGITIYPPSGESASRIIIANNTIRNYRSDLQGIFVYGGLGSVSDIIIKANTCYMDTTGGTGISLNSVTNSIIEANRIINNSTGINEAGSSDYNSIINNILKDCTTPLSTVGENTIVKHNQGALAELLSAYHTSIDVGVNSTYGSTTSITSPTGTIGNITLNLVWSGTFATGETVTIKVEVVYDDGTTTYKEFSKTAVGEYTLSWRDWQGLIKNNATARKINVYAKSDQASTSVVCYVDYVGITP